MVFQIRALDHLRHSYHRWRGTHVRWWATVELRLLPWNPWWDHPSGSTSSRESSCIWTGCCGTGWEVSPLPPVGRWHGTRTCLSAQVRRHNVYVGSRKVSDALGFRCKYSGSAGQRLPEFSGWRLVRLNMTWFEAVIAIPHGQLQSTLKQGLSHLLCFHTQHILIIIGIKVNFWTHYCFISL